MTGRVTPLLVVPLPRPGTVAMLLSKRRVLEEHGVPSPSRVMPLLVIL